MDVIELNGKNYEVIKLLGKGKGGYSYLVSKDNKEYVLKQIHHEPCSYYTFGNKIESELNDYSLLNTLIRLPKLIEYNKETERILKEYIDGPTIFDLVKEGINVEKYIPQIKAMCDKLYSNNLNIDYFPTNFVIQNDILYYIDYECNKYMDEWSFENWGLTYWLNVPL